MPSHCYNGESGSTVSTAPAGTQPWKPPPGSVILVHAPRRSSSLGLRAGRQGALGDVLRARPAHHVHRIGHDHDVVAVVDKHVRGHLQRRGGKQDHCGRDTEAQPAADLCTGFHQQCARSQAHCYGPGCERNRRGLIRTQQRRCPRRHGRKHDEGQDDPRLERRGRERRLKPDVSLSSRSSSPSIETTVTEAIGAGISVISPVGSRTVTRSSGVAYSPDVNSTTSMVWLIAASPSPRSSTRADDCDRTSKDPMSPRETEG